MSEGFPYAEVDRERRAPKGEREGTPQETEEKAGECGIPSPHEENHIKEEGEDQARCSLMDHMRWELTTGFSKTDVPLRTLMGAIIVRMLEGN